MAMAGERSRPAQRLDDGLSVRHACRSGEWTDTTANLAPGFVQANLVILPAAAAEDFMRFCLLNPKPCPLIGVSRPGERHIRVIGADLDIALDLPRYRVWREGEVVDEPTDLDSIWADDFVAFAIGCSFSFEEALMENGVPLRHIELGVTVPMYRTSVACAPSGAFAGPLVVSMRPMKPADAIRAVQITSRFPSVHGAPVHLGLPEQIGIGDLAKPDYGDAVPVNEDELPVFWACGVTPQAVIVKSGLSFAITHAPGCMLVTDLKNSRFAIS